MTSFGIVGTGWRSIFFLRVAQACPDQFQIAGIVTRNPDKAASLAHQYKAPLFTSLEALVETEPAFVVASVPRTVNPGVLHQLADLNMPALSETPPAATVEEMRELYARVEQGAKIQVAEQYFLQPHHAARLAFAHGGKLGAINQAQVSAAHGYHGISLMRKYLGVMFENASITVHNFTSPIVKGPNRNGPPEEESIGDSAQTVAWFDFGDKFGVFDFNRDQYFSHIRNQRLLVRGERGEIINDTAVYLKDYLTPIEVKFSRQSAGQEGNLEGNHLKGIQAGEEWVYQNPLAPGELSDDEIAVGSCMLGMAEYANGGDSFYSLAEAYQDTYLDLLIQEASDSGGPISSETQPWAR